LDCLLREDFVFDQPDDVGGCDVFCASVCGMIFYARSCVVTRNQRARSRG